MAPCEKGLNAECFKARPKWARRVFAYRLLHTIFPGAISKRLPPALGFPFLPPDIILPPGLDIPPGTYYPPGFVWPPGWLPGDPLPPGVVLPVDYPNFDFGPFAPWVIDPFQPGPPSSGGTTPAVDLVEYTLNRVDLPEDGVIGLTGDDWDATHPASLGDFIDITSSLWSDAVFISNQSGSCNIIRTFLEFSLHAIPDYSEIVSCALTIKGYQREGFETSIQEGTQALPPTTSDFGSFTGVYFNKMVLFEPDNGTWGTNVFTFNSAGLAYVKSEFSGNAKFCIRNYDYDYLGVEPTVGHDSINNGFKFFEQLSILDRPTLIVVYMA